ncbi:MAG: hypothetical protein HN712_04095 [Gemmatimonadetes bacterium]|nr:hypothetical protein [Gemmatimonadota bacterium]MBT6147966.1 hypothetical protein [Gemmatimonadota bacterium]MBT7859464.1 hypothetical protein [Gemmatimonadota bacterium]
MPDQTQARSPSTRSRQGRWRGRVAGLVFGVVLVVGVEGVCRGLWPSDPLTVSLAQVEGVELRSTNALYPKRFFRGVVSAARLAGSRMSSQPYLEPDSREPFRVLFVGGSTVQGYPHPRRLAAAAYLEVMLSDALQRPVQVVNLGITAVASFVVARTAIDALPQLQPDLVVVYTGHNELYGIYGAANSGVIPTYWRHRFHYALATTGLGTAAQTLSALLRPDSPDASLLEILGTVGQISPADASRQRAVELLGRNLHDIAAATHAAGIPLALCTLASNETGFPPARDTTQVTARAMGDPQELLIQARSRSDAYQAYKAGQMLQEAGQDRKAAAAFQLAKELDPSPWRAVDALNQTIRDVAEESGATLVDVEAAFRAYSPTAGIGWSLMSDHLHPSAAGQLLLARVVIDALRKQEPTLGLTAAAMARMTSAQTYRIRQGALPVERVGHAIEMAKFFDRPPLSSQGPGLSRKWQHEADSLSASLQPSARAAVDTWQGVGSGPPLVLRVADRLFAAGDYQRAAEHYRAARLEAPFTMMGDLWAASRRAMSLRMAGLPLGNRVTQELHEARYRSEFLRQAADFDPAFGHFFDGVVAHLLSEHELALQHLEIASEDAGIQRNFTFDLMACLVAELQRADREEDAFRFLSWMKTTGGQPELADRFLYQLHNQAATR